MSQDRITLILKDISKLKNELAEVKKTIRKMEKIDTEEYRKLKITYKELREDIKEMENDWKSNLTEDSDYNELIELKMKHEEEIAQTNEKLFTEVAKLPQKPVNIKVENEEGFFNVDIIPDMRVFVNGKEEKKRAM